MLEISEYGNGLCNEGFRWMKMQMAGFFQNKRLENILQVLRF